MVEREPRGVLGAGAGSGVGQRQSEAVEENYRAWDREEKLGPPPWKHDDPKLIAWEAAHGHDVRLKCYPEFGCQVLPDYEALVEQIEAMLPRMYDGMHLVDCPYVDVLMRIRAAITNAQSPMPENER